MRADSDVLGFSIKRRMDFERFDNTMQALLKIPHSEIKAKLDAEKQAKKRKKDKKERP